jgi:predicted metal-dependent enzyme (double-stranded beta helix superfamily)
MVSNVYSLADFTREVDGIIEEGLDDALLTRRVEKPLRVLLADMSWLDPRCAEPVPGRSVQYLLHRHPEDAYTIVSVVFPPGYSTPVHDHTTWGLVGVWGGEEQEERFVREDDRSDPDHARLRSVGTVTNAPISVCRLLPPDQEIHRIRNLGAQPACSIHIYGGFLHGRLRHSFDPETGEISEFRTTVVVIDS